MEMGPESAVWRPGARERELSREVAKVRVTWGLGGDLVLIWVLWVFWER